MHPPRASAGVYLLYIDHEGGQRTITLFSLSLADDTSSGWLTLRYPPLDPDRADPR